MFKFEMRVTYNDIAPGNHVYYSRYLEWLEAARGEAFREMGRSFREFQEEGLMFPVVECLLKYNKPARYDEIVEVRSWFAEVEKVRFLWEYEIARDEEILVDARTLHICASLQEKPQRMPPKLVTAMKEHVRA